MQTANAQQKEQEAKNMAVIERSVRDDPPRSMAGIIYGPPKSGKTTFVGTSPRPVFIVPSLERGTSSLKELMLAMEAGGNRMEDIIYIPVETIQEMEAACYHVRNNYQKRGWRTLGVDPFSTYGNIVQNELSLAHPDMDRWTFYRMVKQHLINIWKLLQGCNLHTWWVCHEDEPDERNPNIRPLLVGGAITDISASVDVIARLQKIDEVIKDEKGGPKVASGGGFAYQTLRKLWVRAPSNAVPPFVAGSRWETRLTEPWYYPHFDVLRQRLHGIIAE